jgi:hypothetical protein
MELLVIGHLCIDIHHGVGIPEREEWGGIANAIAALGSLADKDDTIIPLCGVGSAEQQGFLSWLARYPAVETSTVFLQEEPTNCIHLYEQNDGTRVACAKAIAPPIPFERVKKYLSVDGILINMESGFDISLETLDRIRMEVRGKNVVTHFDYHNLTMGINGNGERFRRPLSDWRRWAFMNTTVQLNEEETAGLAVERLSEHQTVGHLLTLGTRGVVITRGSRGATLYTNEHKKVARHDTAVIPASATEDATGLGDAFGAAFVHHLVQSSDLIASVEAANRIAAEAASRSRNERWLTNAPE